MDRQQTKYLVAVRERLGLSQAGFAQHVGLSDGLIGQVETGRRNLGQGSINKIAAGLGLTRRQKAELEDAVAADKASGPVLDESPLGVRMAAMEAQIAEVQRRLAAIEAPVRGASTGRHLRAAESGVDPGPTKPTRRRSSRPSPPPEPEGP